MIRSFDFSFYGDELLQLFAIFSTIIPALK